MWPSGLTLAMTLTLNFQGQIYNLLYLSQKWFDCHETKSKHIDWTQGLICDHQVWPWPWPWPWIFKVEYWICYISAKSGPIANATKRKANISIELQDSNVGNYLDHDLHLWIFKVKCDLDLWPHTWPWPWIFMDLPDSDQGDFSCRCAIDSWSICFPIAHKLCNLLYSVAVYSICMIIHVRISKLGLDSSLVFELLKQ